jgi:predicted alpha/beta-fold hydrolase
MAPGDLVPREAIAANPCLTLQMPDEGGHVGFVEGTPRHHHLWAEDAAAQFLAEWLEAGGRRAVTGDQ